MRCANHRKTYDEKTGPGLWLVHDQGVYLMSNGIPHLEDPEKPEGSKVVQAEGCDPKKDEDWWETSRELVGGDDFVEFVPVDTMDELFEGLKGYRDRKLVIEVTATSFEMYGEGVQCNPPQKKTKEKKAASVAAAVSDDIDL